MPNPSTQLCVSSLCFRRCVLAPGRSSLPACGCGEVHGGRTNGTLQARPQLPKLGQGQTLQVAVPWRCWSLPLARALCCLVVASVWRHDRLNPAGRGPENRSLRGRARPFRKLCHIYVNTCPELERSAAWSLLLPQGRAGGTLQAGIRVSDMRGKARPCRLCRVGDDGCPVLELSATLWLWQFARRQDRWKPAWPKCWT